MKQFIFRFCVVALVAATALVMKPLASPDSIDNPLRPIGNVVGNVMHLIERRQAIDAERREVAEAIDSYRRSQPH